VTFLYEFGIKRESRVPQLRFYNERYIIVRAVSFEVQSPGKIVLERGLIISCHYRMDIKCNFLLGFNFQCRSCYIKTGCTNLKRVSKY